MSENVEVLKYMRSALDDRRPMVTKLDRLTEIASFFMTSTFSEDDPLVELSEYIPQNEALEEWCSTNRLVIASMRRQDKNDKWSDRFDLEEDSKKFKESAWMHNAEEGLRIMPFQTEIVEAAIVIKLLYQEASMAHDRAAS